MKTAIKRTGLVSAIVALAAIAACSNDKTELDPALKADLAAIGGTTGDLQLAPTSNRSSVVLSAIEGGPQAAPKKAAPVRTVRPTPKQAPHVAAAQAPAERPAAVAEVEQAPAPQPEQPAIQSTRQAPAPAPQQDRRVYKTEAEIFRQMPWIRP
jgi:hypothetical protein